MAAFLNSWRPRQTEITVESNWEQYCPYPPQSLPVLLPSAKDDASKQAALPLFGAASASMAGSGLVSDEGSSSSGGNLSSVEAQDVVLNAGGPVWGLDWCPAGTGGSGDGNAVAAAAAAAAAADSYLAVACHPPDAAHHVIGTAVQGPASIQIWAVSNPARQQQPGEQQQQQQQDGLPPPRMALALAHDGGLTWHCQWCPDAALADSPNSSSSSDGSTDTLPRLGLLAAALGDGSLQVWAVPHPSAAAQLRPQGGAAGAAAAAPLVLSLPPVAAVSSAALGGSMPSVVEWMPAAPHDLLAVGCWDGSVAIFKLAPGQQQQQQQQQQGPGGSGSEGSGGSHPQMFGLELLSHFSADALPLRSLRWLPPGQPGTTIDLLHRHILVTGGNEGVLRLWDLRDPFQPIYSHVLSSSSVILSVGFTSQPFGMLAAMDDASLRGVVLDSDLVEAGVASYEKKAMFSVTWRGTDMGAIWSMAMQPTTQFVAYGGEDGVVGVFRADYDPAGRRRQHHIAVAGWRLEGAALALKSPTQLSAYRGLFAGKVEERKERLHNARLPEEAEAVHRVAWSLHGSGGAAWLASAGAAGLVRCQWIASQ